MSDTCSKYQHPGGWALWAEPLGCSSWAQGLAREWGCRETLAVLGLELWGQYQELPGGGRFQLQPGRPVQSGGQVQQCNPSHQGWRCPARRTQCHSKGPASEIYCENEMSGHLSYLELWSRRFPGPTFTRNWLHGCLGSCLASFLLNLQFKQQNLEHNSCSVHTWRNEKIVLSLYWFQYLLVSIGYHGSFLQVCL